MAITFLQAVRSIARLTISFAFELAEQQIMLAKQLNDRLLKPHEPQSRLNKATVAVPNPPLATTTDDVRQALAGKTIDVSTHARVTGADDAAAQALVPTPDGSAAQALVPTADGRAAQALVPTPDGAPAQALVTTPDGAAQALVTTPDGAAQALVTTPHGAVQPPVTIASPLADRADDAIEASVTTADDAAPVLATTTDEDQELPLREERLVINKQRVQHGEAHVRKEVVTEVKSIAVPVNHEELVVERHAVMGDVAIESEPIADETIRVPLSEQKVNIGKETVVREEVEIGKRHVEDVEHINDSVRHEELRVDDPRTVPVTPRANPEKIVTTADDAAPAPALVPMQAINTTSTENEQAVFDARVQQRAYALWQAEGRPDGRQLDHWARAQLELSAMRPNAANDC